MAECIRQWRQKLIDSGYQEMVFEDAMDVVMDQLTRVGVSENALTVASLEVPWALVHHALCRVPHGRGWTKASMCKHVVANCHLPFSYWKHIALNPPCAGNDA